MNKAILLVFVLMLLANLVYAEDIAYILTNDPEPAFIEAFNDLHLSYKIIDHDEVKDNNLTRDFKIIVINNDYFVNWDDIPINEMPALVANSYNVVDWGWTTQTTAIKKQQPIVIGINRSSEMTSEMPENITVYTSQVARMYLLDKIDVFSGIENVGYSLDDKGDIIVGIVRKGTTLTHQGKPSTQVHANGVFFGITDTTYWTPETKQLFENALLFLYEPTTYNINIDAGKNLVSFPLAITKTVAQIKSANPWITSIQEFNGVSFVDATTIQPGKGYLIDAASAGTLTITGSPGNGVQNFNLVKGMNLVGVNSLNTISYNTLPSQVIEFGKRNSDGTFTLATKYNNWVNPFNFESGKGYWIKATQNTIWTYTP